MIYSTYRIIPLIIIINLTYILALIQNYSAEALYNSSIIMNPINIVIYSKLTVNYIKSKFTRLKTKTINLD